MYPDGCADDFRGQVAGFDVRTPRRKTLTTKLAKHTAKDVKEDVTNDPKCLSLASRGVLALVVRKDFSRVGTQSVIREKSLRRPAPGRPGRQEIGRAHV